MGRTVSQFAMHTLMVTDYLSAKLVKDALMNINSYFEIWIKFDIVSYCVKYFIYVGDNLIWTINPYPWTRWHFIKYFDILRNILILHLSHHFYHHLRWSIYILQNVHNGINYNQHSAFCIVWKSRVLKSPWVWISIHMKTIIQRNFLSLICLTNPICLYCMAIEKETHVWLVCNQG